MCCVQEKEKEIDVHKQSLKFLISCSALCAGEGDGDCSRLSPGCLQSEYDLLQAVEDMGILEKTRFRRSTEDISSRTKRAFPARSVRVNPLLPPNRRQSSQRFPPIMRPEGAQFRGVCRQCVARSTVCTVYSIGEIITYAIKCYLQITEEVEKLKALKLESGENVTTGAGSSKIVLKTAKGTRDYLPDQMIIRENVIDIVKNVFKRHDAETIDTPVFELKVSIIVP